MRKRLQLSLSANGLPNLKGMFQTSDPFAVVTHRGDSPDNSPEVVGCTDVAFDNLSPSWSTIVFLEDYKFGVPYYIEVGVFDFDATAVGAKEQKLKQKAAHSKLDLAIEASRCQGKFPHKVMGTALFEVGELLGSRTNVGFKLLQKGGVLTAAIERSVENGAKGFVQLKLRAQGLKNVQSLGRTSSPFFELSRRVERPNGATWVKVYRSNVARNELNPMWDEALLDIESVCNGDLDRAIKVTILDHRRNGKHKHMGEFETTVNGLVSSMIGNDNGDALGFSIRNKHGKEIAECFPVIVKVQDLSEEQNSLESSVQAPEFIDYLTGGCEINLAVAIDFTSANGDPRQPKSLHYLHRHHHLHRHSTEFNDYEKAIFAVGSILARYDYDQKFPVWGFGARFDGVVRHCFRCGSEHEVEGVVGVLEAYRSVFRSPWKMSLSRNFSEIIGTAKKYANEGQKMAESQGKQSYTILLILTAGDVDDVERTKKDLIAASNDPMSVVIVGIGGLSFEGMEFLDSFDPAKEAGRDITKFVRFNDCENINQLTEAVLDEIPDQVVEYFYHKRGILPGNNEEDIGAGQVTIQSADSEMRTIAFLGDF